MHFINLNPILFPHNAIKVYPEAKLPRVIFLAYHGLSFWLNYFLFYFVILSFPSVGLLDCH